MIPYVVIGGYLGAGKTTLLNRLLTRATDRRIGLLINDFGEINIDAALIESATDQQINLTNGCICCSLADGFTEALDQLTAVEPPLDLIVVEASGVADVGLLAQYGHGKALNLQGAVVLADAETIIERADDRYVSRTVRRQLAAADLIVLTRCDLVTDERLENVKAWLTRNMPHTPFVESTDADVALLFDEISPAQHTVEGQIAHEHYATCAIVRESPVTLAQLEAFVGALGDDVIRAKGVVSLNGGSGAVVHVVGQRREITCFEAEAGQSMPDKTELVLIGLHGVFDKARVEALAQQLLAP